MFYMMHMKVLKSAQKIMEKLQGTAQGTSVLNEWASGLHADVILAARPSVRKTAFILNIAKNVLLIWMKQLRFSVLKWGGRVFSRDSYLFSCESDNARLFENRKLTDEIYAIFRGDRGSCWSAYLYRWYSRKLSEVRAKCRRLGARAK